MASKIKIGAVYKNGYGDLRIPLCVLQDGLVVYIEKTADEKLFGYNPYRDAVKEANFLRKFSISDTGNQLTLNEIDKLAQVIVRANMEWSQLLLDARKEIKQIIK